MSFRLFGWDVEITVGFWAMSAFMGFIQFQNNWRLVLAWVALVLIGILVHELGHALAFHVFGVPSQIQLHYMGGLTAPLHQPKLTRVRNIIVSVAGPAAGLLLGGVTFAISMFVPMSPLAHQLVAMSIFINVYWSFVNLLPVLPFDGGYVFDVAIETVQLLL